MRDKIFALSIDRDTGNLHITEAETACNRVHLGWHIITQGTEKEVTRKANRYRRNPAQVGKYLTL